jgi:FG-GAP-like repeat
MRNSIFLMLQCKRIIVVVLTSVMLSSCGGGGGGGSNGIQTNNQPTPTDLFSSTPTYLVSLKSRYDQLCGNKTSLNTIPIDLNKDGKKDLLIQIYCSRQPINEPNVGSVPNNIIALVQNNDGSFSDKTLQVFGSNTVSAEGKVQEFIKYDFNEDGFEDVVMTMDGEDGSTPIDSSASNIKFATLSILSNGDNTYRLESFGANVWGSDLRLINATVGKPILVVLPADNGTQGWTYNNGWVQVQGYDWVSTFSNVFLDPTGSNTFSTVAANSTKDSNSQSVEIYNRTGNSWAQASATNFITYQQKNFSDTGRSFNLARVFGKDFIDPFLYDGCTFKQTAGSNPLPLFSMLGNEISGGYTIGQILNEPQGVQSWGQVNLVTFDIDQSSNATNFRSLISVSLERNYLQLMCQDINSDGVQDVFIRNLANPIIIVNDGSGNLKAVNKSKLPSNPSSSRYTYVYEDMDGDGIRDLLFFPLGGDQIYNQAWDYNGFRLTMYKGLRNISISDAN